MKQTLTLLALAFAGAAQSQPLNQPAPLPASLRAISRLTPLPFSSGPQEILHQQATAGAAKTAATAYRITGWSRYDLQRNRILDTSRFFYSGGRGSSFVNERENLDAGTLTELSMPDLFQSSADGGIGFNDREFRYDAANRVTVDIHRVMLGAFKYETSYDAAGRMVLMLESDSTSAGWEPTVRLSIRYNAAGQRLADSMVSVQGRAPLSLVRYHYNKAGDADSVSGFEWEPTIGGWRQDYLQELVHTASRKLSVTTIFYPDETTGMMVPGSRMGYIYTGSDLLKSSTSMSFERNAWQNRFRDSYDYTGAKTLYTTRTTSFWDNATNGWNERYKWSYTLDGNDRWNMEYFDSRLNGVMTPENKTAIHYNAAGLVDYTETYPYELTQKAYVQNPSVEEHFYYQSFQTTGIATTSGFHMQLYPNPATSEVNIDSRGGIRHVDVYNASGAIVTSITINGRMNARIDVNSLPSGIYYLQALLVEGVAHVLRFIKR